MMKKIIAASAISATVMLSGCATGLSPVGTGLITDVKGPIAVTGLTGSKKGEACASSILGIVDKGDASIEAAKAAGGITAVASADYHTKGFYPFYGTTCVTVTGK